jgi:hypothetical protein
MAMFAAQEVANSIWAVAKLQQQLTNDQLQELVGYLTAQLPDISPQEVVNTLWALAAMNQRQTLLQQVCCPAGAQHHILELCLTLAKVATIG